MGFQINDSVTISDWLKIKINLKPLLRLFLALIESFESLGSQDISSVSESPQASFFSICFFIAFNSAIFVDNAIFPLKNVSFNQNFHQKKKQFRANPSVSATVSLILTKRFFNVSD